MSMLATRSEISNVYKLAGVRRRWLFFPLTQIPVFYGFYKNLQGMAEIPVPGLADGGIGWFTDLSVGDPFYLLPAMTSAALFIQLSMGGESGTNLQTEKVKRAMLIILPIITFSFSSFWPAVLSFYFLCNSTISLLQTFVLKQAWVRERFGLYPLVQTAVGNPLSPVFKTVSPNTEEVKQIGGKGSWLDRITGGDKQAEKDVEESGFLGGLFQGVIPPIYLPFRSSC
jgi:YidC/Oxa1 family membrane protein insertase